jgi:hypothetical protein
LLSISLILLWCKISKSIRRCAASLAKELAKVKISSRLTENENQDRLRKSSNESGGGGGPIKDDAVAEDRPITERQESRDSQQSRSSLDKKGRRNSNSIKLIK